MGWLRRVGSLKWSVSFAEYSPLYRALLQTRHVILRSLLIVATPYLIYTQYTSHHVGIVHIWDIIPLPLNLATMMGHVLISKRLGASIHYVSNHHLHVEPYFYRALLQKRPVILRSLLIVATPYLLGVSIHYVLTHHLHLEPYLFYRALLQKRPVISRSLLIVATPYRLLMFLVINCISNPTFRLDLLTPHLTNCVTHMTELRNTCDARNTRVAERRRRDSCIYHIVFCIS